MKPPNANVGFRALPDITSGPEVRKIFEKWTVRKPDIFLHGHRASGAYPEILLSSAPVYVVPVERMNSSFACLSQAMHQAIKRRAPTYHTMG